MTPTRWHSAPAIKGVCCARSRSSRLTRNTTGMLASDRQRRQWSMGRRPCWVARARPCVVDRRSIAGCCAALVRLVMALTRPSVLARRKGRRTLFVKAMRLHCAFAVAHACSCRDGPLATLSDGDSGNKKSPPCGWASLCSNCAQLGTTRHHSNRDASRRTERLL